MRLMRKPKDAIWTEILLSAVFICIVGASLFGIVYAFIPYTSENQIHQEAISIWGNMTVAQQQVATTLYHSMCGQSSGFGPTNWSFDDFLFYIYRPKPMLSP